MSKKAAAAKVKTVPTAVVVEAVPVIVEAQADAALAALGARWKAGEKITVLAAEAGQPWNTLYAQLFKLGYHPTRQPKA